MAKITNTQTQYNTKGIAESDLRITVDFDAEERTVDEIISVETYNYRRNVFTDITAIMKEQFDYALEKMVSKIDWDEIYHESFTLAAHH